MGHRPAAGLRRKLMVRLVVTASGTMPNDGAAVADRLNDDPGLRELFRHEGGDFVFRSHGNAPGRT